MTYILVQAFIKYPLQLLRLPGLIIFWLKYRLATTPRQKAAVWQDTHLKYGTNVTPCSPCCLPAAHLLYLQSDTTPGALLLGCCAPVRSVIR